MTKFAPQGLVGQTDAAFAMAIQSDGKIVVAGLSNAGRSSTFTFEFALARYNPDGTLDEGFGTDGNVLTPFSPDSNDKAFAIALQPDGKIVVAGNSNPDRSGPNFALARYTSGGILDATFGNGGLVTTGFFPGSSDQANAVVVQPDGKILAAGFSIGGSDCDFALVRYSADGALDTTFGSGGKVVTDFSQFSCDEGNAVAEGVFCRGRKATRNGRRSSDHPVLDR